MDGVDSSLPLPATDSLLVSSVSEANTSHDREAAQQVRTGGDGAPQPSIVVSNRFAAGSSAASPPPNRVRCLSVTSRSAPERPELSKEHRCGPRPFRVGNASRGAAARAVVKESDQPPGDARVEDRITAAHRPQHVLLSRVLHYVAPCPSPHGVKTEASCSTWSSTRMCGLVCGGSGPEDAGRHVHPEPYWNWQLVRPPSGLLHPSQRVPLGGGTQTARGTRRMRRHTHRAVRADDTLFRPAQGEIRPHW